VTEQHEPPSVTDRADLLETIVAATRRTIEIRENELSLAALAERAEAVPSRAGRLHAALSGSDGYHVIAECKRRSPSRGVLRASYDPAAIAAGYARAGAAAISVLTEPTFFDGSLDHFRDVRAVVDVPLLRKDFIVSEYQLLEAKLAGADAVLLIVAALRPAQLKVLHDHARRHGLDVLVEAHDATELSIAIDAGARIVGVNNRNLRTLQVDVRASEILIGRIPSDIVAVAESGLKTSDDLVRLKALGYRAFLIGERFMTAAEPGEQLRELLASAAETEDTKAMKDAEGRR
jgi:indole-3-glycerol phosphate synthase